ncbi:hypothetical protein XELAEV_18021510mg [Xenopus laevis]|uniref:LRRNT domain-containing protein n=1 Tax=Xenopus laevis TaxID=8355 RepID=A0A974HS17_XENLA|nr:hypothetical protein XELAEV_18021510mg [Xenopus laevis]
MLPLCRGFFLPVLAPLCLWSLFTFIALVSGCPSKCTCSGPNVECHGLGLKTVPKGIPRNAERLSWVSDE